MLLQLILQISLLLSSLFLISRYVIKHKKPLNHQSPLSDKLLIGFFYGLVGGLLIYANKEVIGNCIDLRQIVVLLAFFYGGWTPALVSSAFLIITRLIVFDGASAAIFTLSLVTTLVIAYIVMRLPIARAKQWYLITAGVMIKIYIYLLFYGTDSSSITPDFFYFALAFILGSVFSYHFTESLHDSYEVMEELRQSKESLQRSEADYRLIAEHSSDLIAVLSVEGKGIYLSPSHFTILGFRPEEYIGKPLLVGTHIHPEDYFRFLREWQRAITEKKASRTEFRYQHVDGQWVWIESHYKPVLGADDTIDKVVVISRDVTERKQTDELLRNAEKLSVVGELAAGIAHEIRNPLTTLKGFIQIMKKEPSSSSFFHVMYEELKRIESITNELLYLAKPQVQEFKQTNINEMIEQTTALFYPEALLNNIVLTVQCDDNLPPITCVENRVKQVFINLLKNSKEAMPDGGKIVIETMREGTGTVLISIKDQGIGIPEDRIEKLGQPFYTLKEKGTGLGLTVCKKIIQEHDGSMTFQSTVDLGTTVEVRLPIVTSSNLVSS